jgi:hypothetical protein
MIAMTTNNSINVKASTVRTLRRVFKGKAGLIGLSAQLLDSLPTSSYKSEKKILLENGNLCSRNGVIANAIYQ